MVGYSWCWGFGLGWVLGLGCCFAEVSVWVFRVVGLGCCWFGVGDCVFEAFWTWLVGVDLLWFGVVSDLVVFRICLLCISWCWYNIDIALSDRLLWLVWVLGVVVDCD